MPTNPAFENYFQSIAKTIANQKTATPSSNVWSGYKPLTGEAVPQTKKEADWNLGQGLIDLLSSGTYAVAGIGQRVGESFTKLNQGDLSNVLADVTGLGLIQGVTSGVANRRTWSQNLEDAGVSQADAAGWGLGLDIVLDPFWLIPGGSIAAGVKGTARGIGVGSALNKAGVAFTKEAAAGVKAATEGMARPGLRNLALGQKEAPLGALESVLKPTGTKIPAYSPQGVENFYRGIKQANIENYVEWAANRRLAKAAKAAKRQAKADVRTGSTPLVNDAITVLDNAVNDVPVDIATKAPEPVTPAVTANPAEQATQKAVDAVEAQTKTQTKRNIQKDPESAQRAIDTALGKADPLEESAAVLGKTRDEYAIRAGMDPLKVNLKDAKAATYASEMAKVYDELVSAPNDPAVRSAYAKLVEESRAQYDYMTKELGIKVDYVNEDPYTKIKDGVAYPSPRAMAEDVVKNKHLYVRASEPDFAINPHPILTAEENNIFRAVHDFFGHAASGRGFMADGEEAAWMSHSTMFSPEARRAMTTETRGQNSYYNFFNPESKQFAEQKAALFPEEYTLLPAELDAITGQITKTNTFFGRVTNALSSFADNILDDLGLISTPIKGTKVYSPEKLAEIERTAATIVKKDVYKQGTPEHKLIIGAIDNIINKLGQRSVDTGFVEKLRELKGVSGTSGQLLQQILDRPVVINELVQELAAAEGKYLTAPAPFKPTTWGPRYEPTADSRYIGQNPDTSVGFSEDYLANFFPNDPLLSDPKKLGIAFGKTPLKQAKVYVRKGESPLGAYKRYQSAIWEDFRTRNMGELENIKQAEKAAYDAKYSQLDSEIFARQANGDMIGIGNLPTALPRATISGSFDGSIATTLGRMIENIGTMIKRPAPRNTLGAPGYQITGGTYLLKQVLNKNIEDVISPEYVRVIESAKISGPEFKVVGANGRRLTNVVSDLDAGVKLPEGAKLVPANPAAKKLIETLKTLKPEIATDTLNPTIQKWLVAEFKKLRKNINENGITDHVSGQTASDIEANIAKLMGTGVIKSYADAKMVILGGKEAIKELSKKVARKFYVKSDIAVRRSLTTGSNQERKQLLRLPSTGTPLKQLADGYKIATEREATVISQYPDYRLLTSEGQAFTGRKTGRAGSEFAPQTGLGRQQLAGLQAIRDTIGNISTGITAKEFSSSPEQAQLLTSVMTSLGIKVADNASPEQVFKLFQEKAAITFQEVVDGIQAAAKQEAVIYQARNVFARSVEQNISLMKVIDSLDPGELQKSVVEFTDDAVTLVDNYCAASYANIGGNAAKPTSILDTLTGGTSAKIGIID